MNAIDKLLMRMLSSRAASIGKLHEDLSPVFAAAPTFYQSSILEAINSANHSRGVKAQMSSNTTNGIGLSARLGVTNQTQNDKLGHAKPMLMSMLESHADNSAQVQENRSEVFGLLIDWRLILLGKEVSDIDLQLNEEYTC